MDDTPASLKSFSIVNKLGKKMIRHYCYLRKDYGSSAISYLDAEAPSLNCDYCKKNYQFEALRTELGL